MKRHTAFVPLFILIMAQFMACSTEPSPSAEAVLPEKEYKEIGLAHAQATQAALATNLVTQINAHGTEGALSFCNTKAIQLTDSMAQQQGAGIKRASDHPRNPANRANDDELAYITAQKERLANGEKITPFTFEKGGKMIGYYPIMTNAMCLQCHGSVGMEIADNTHAKLMELYPDDEATGYTAEQLRGIWVVEMEK